MSLYELLAVVWRRRLLFVAIVAVVTLTGVAWALLMTPIYRGTVVVMPAPEDSAAGALVGLSGQFGGLAALAGVNMGGGTKDEALATLRSREFTERFLQEENLLPKLFDKKWDESRGAWREGVKPPTLGDGFKLFSEQVRTVSEDRRTGIVTLNVDWKDRELAALWANQQIERLNRQMRERAIDESTKVIGYLDQQLATANQVELQEAIGRLKESQIKRIMLASVRDEYALRVIDKARPSDPDKRVKPYRSLMVLAAGMLGGMLALCVIALVEWWPRQTSRSAREP
jgi:uncharacterized protein involved in exopolysaccharide biosynthesis